MTLANNYYSFMLYVCKQEDDDDEKRLNNM